MVSKFEVNMVKLRYLENNLKAVELKKANKIRVSPNLSNK